MIVAHSFGGFSGALAAARVPTRLLVFADDRFFPPEFMRAVVRDRLGIEADAVPGGHLAMVSHPDELADRLVAYL